MDNPEQNNKKRKMKEKTIISFIQKWWREWWRWRKRRQQNYNNYILMIGFNRKFYIIAMTLFQSASFVSGDGIDWDGLCAAIDRHSKKKNQKKYKSILAMLVRLNRKPLQGCVVTVMSADSIRTGLIRELLKTTVMHVSDVRQRLMDSRSLRQNAPANHLWEPTARTNMRRKKWVDFQ